MTPRHEIDSTLKGETLVRKGLMHRMHDQPTLRLVPELNIVKIGGHGIIDYGREVVMPLMEEIGELSRNHKMLVVTGGGVRVRHILDIGIDLGMPTGVLAELAGKISEQNAEIVTLLLSKWGGSKVKTGDILDLPTMLHLGLLPVIHGTPPYGLYEHPPGVGMIPPHRTDVGAFLLAEVMGAERCVLIKDENGLYTADPKKDRTATLIPEIEVNELLARDLNDLAVKRSMLESLQTARSVREVFIVNGLVRGNIPRALAGENVGTRIYVKG